MQIIKVGNYQVGQGHPLMLMAGPCVLEGYERSLMIGQRTKAICEELGIPYVFKASFDKANRSSYASFRGPGIEEGLKLLAQIKKDLGVPVVTDIHEPWQAEKAAEVVDILQIPAFLCRQTDLVWAAAKTGKAINVKKGQFLAPWDMKNVIKKVEEAGNTNLMLTERGASFGYNTEPIVSSDVIGMKFGSLFDATQTMVAKLDDETFQVQVVSWYDNENSYTSQMVRTIKYFAEL